MLEADSVRTPEYDVTAGQGVAVTSWAEDRAAFKPMDQPLCVPEPSVVHVITVAVVTARPDRPPGEEPEYVVPSTVKMSQQLSVLNVATVRVP